MNTKCNDDQAAFELLEAIPTKQLVEMLKDPPEDVDWTGNLGLFRRAAWRIEELDGLFSPRFIVPRASYSGRVHEAVNEAVSAFMQHPHTIRYKDRWLKPEEYQISIGACGVMIQAYLDFFTSVQEGEEKPAPENTIDATIRPALEAKEKAVPVDHPALVEYIAEKLWRCDYPQGGSIYRTYESTPFHDKELYRKQAITELQQIIGE